MKTSAFQQKLCSDIVMKIYTKTGDKGQTSLVGGQRVSKADSRLEAYGTVDELNAVLGLLIADLENQPADFSTALSTLKQTQNFLFHIGSHLACNDEKIKAGLPKLQEDWVKAYEQEIDAMTAELPPLKEFILPGGSFAASWSHLGRTIARRAERCCVALEDTEPMVVQILNRLSDYLFVLARFCNLQLGSTDVTWKK